MRKRTHDTHQSGRRRFSRLLAVVLTGTLMLGTLSIGTLADENDAVDLTEDMISTMADGARVVYTGADGQLISEDDDLNGVKEEAVTVANPLIVDADGGVVKIVRDGLTRVWPAYYEDTNDGACEFTRTDRALPTPERDGYIFKGWNMYTFDDMTTADYYTGYTRLNDEIYRCRGFKREGIRYNLYYSMTNPKRVAELLTPEEANAFVGKDSNGAFKNKKVIARAMWEKDESSIKTVRVEGVAVPDGVKHIYSSPGKMISGMIARTHGWRFKEVDYKVYEVSFNKFVDGQEVPVTNEEVIEGRGAYQALVPYPEGTDEMDDFMMGYIHVGDQYEGVHEYTDPIKATNGLVMSLDTCAPVILVKGEFRRATENRILAGSGGDGRYDTNTLIAAEAFPSGASKAVFVTGKKFPDALSANGFAGSLGPEGVPILMSRLTGLPASTKKLLTETWGRSVKTAYVVGAGFTADFENDLKACGITEIKHIAGPDRYATAEEVLKAGLKSGQYDSEDTLVVATGVVAADALSMSSWCYSLGMPMLLVGSSGKMRESGLELIRQNHFKRIMIAGGENRVDGKQFEALGYKEYSTLIRLAGNDRYQTSMAIAEHFTWSETIYNNSEDGLCFAPGADANFPDALSGGMLAGKYKRPVLLIGKSDTADTTSLYIHNGYYRSIFAYSLGACADEAIRTRIDKAVAKDMYEGNWY